MLEVIGAGFGRTGTASTKAVPADRLLVYDVTEGWEPLCAFLGVPVPDRPVPSFNDRQAFRELFGLDRTTAPEPVRYSKEQVEGHFREALPDTGAH